jgi:hypothetical protein
VLPVTPFGWFWRIREGVAIYRASAETARRHLPKTKVRSI